MNTVGTLATPPAWAAQRLADGIGRVAREGLMLSHTSAARSLLSGSARSGRPIGFLSRRRRHSPYAHRDPRVAPSPAPMTIRLETLTSLASFFKSSQARAAAMSFTRLG